MSEDYRLIAEKAVKQHGAAQKIRELTVLLGFLDDLKPEVIVEIGVFGGGTMYAWNRIVPNPTLIGIDLLPGGDYPVYGTNNQPRNEHGATVIVGDSHHPTVLWALQDELDGRPIDFLFIDGDHSYEGVRKDYETYAPLVRPGGIIAFHDIVTHAYQLGCEVVKLWGEVRDENSVEIIDTEGDSWGGIGVLHV